MTNDSVLTSVKSFPTVEIITKRDEKVISLDTVRIAIQNQHNVEQILNTLSCNHIKNYGDGNAQTISFRGASTVQSKTYWNHVPLYSPMLSLANLSTISLQSLNAIEINASGDVQLPLQCGAGTINCITNPIWNNDKLTLDVGMASFETYAVFLKSKIRVNKNQFQWMANYVKSEANFPYEIYKLNKIRQHNNYSRFGFSNDNFFSFKKSTFSFQQMFSFLDKNLPYAVIIDAPSVAYQKDIFYINKLQCNTKIKRIVDLEMYASYNFQQLVYSNSAIHVYSKSDNSNLFFNAKATAPFKIRNHLLKNSNSFFLHQTYIQSNDYKRIIKDFRWQWENNLEHRIGAWHNMANVSIIKSNTIFQNVNFSHTYQYRKQSFKLKYFANYNLPSYNDLYWPISGNINLKSEKIFGLEFIYQGQWTFNKKSDLRVNINPFLKRVNDQIFWQPNELLGSGIWSPKNLKSVVIKGLETNLSFPFINRKKQEFSAELGYQYVQALNNTMFYEGDISYKKQIMFTPRHKLNIALRYIQRRLTVSMDNRFVSRRYYSTDNNYFLNPYFLSDCTLQYKMPFSKLISASVLLSVQNIWNTKYEELFGFPLPLRNFNIRFIFNHK